jgi:hypothetical protein
LQKLAVGAAIARMLALELAMGLLLGLGLFQRDGNGLPSAPSSST